MILIQIPLLLIGSSLGSVDLGLLKDYFSESRIMSMNPALVKIEAEA